MNPRQTKAFEAASRQSKRGTRDFEPSLSGPKEVFDADFDGMLSRKPVVVVDCWASWCGPCQLFAPAFDEVAEEFSEKALFLKLNVDKNSEVPARFGVMSIPTILVFKGGRHVDSIIGLLPKPVFRERIKAHL